MIKPSSQSIINLIGLTSLHALAKPLPNEPLNLYISSRLVAVNVVLVITDNDCQLSLYFVSKIIVFIDIKYLKMEYISSPRLLRYKNCDLTSTIMLLTHRPLKYLLQKLNSSRIMIKWEVELSEFKITFTQKTMIKVQTVAHLIVNSIRYDLTNVTKVAPKETPPI